MIETTFAFLLGLYISWWFWIPAAILIFVCESTESYIWMAVLNASLVFSLYLVFKIPFNPWFLVVYPFIGFGWSCYRYFRYVDYVKENPSVVGKGAWRDISGPDTDKEKQLQKLKETLAPSNNKDKIISWIMWWPLSFVQYFTRDIYDFISRFVDRYLIQVYQTILDKALDK